MSAEHRHALPRGHRLGKYRVERYLGAGAFGITYAAYDEDLGRRVAIKEYLPSEWAVREANDSVVARTTDDEDDFRWGLGRFTDEARSLARFRHPTIVGVYEHLRANATAYLVMEYVEGEPLDRHLRRKGTLTEAEIERSVLPILRGLERVHAEGLLHRDIKPGNIVLRRDGTPVLIDFGAARQAVSARTHAVTSLVTHGYSPLEQYSTGTRQTPASDLYAFCAVLYRCIVGCAPTDATDRALGKALVMPQQAVNGRKYSDGLLRGIEQGLALKSESRPRDICELRSMLGGGRTEDSMIAWRAQGIRTSVSGSKWMQERLLGMRAWCARVLPSRLAYFNSKRGLFWAGFIFLTPITASYLDLGEVTIDALGSAFGLSTPVLAAFLFLGWLSKRL